MDQCLGSTTSLVRPGLAGVKRKELPGVKEKLKQRVPQLDYRDVRRARLPFHEALCLDLTEDNCPFAASIIQRLVEIDRIRIGRLREGEKLKSLQASKDVLFDIYNHLRLAEQFHHEANYGQECRAVFELAETFAASDLHWVADELFHNVMTRLRANELGDDGKLEAQIRCKYGAFLRERMQTYNEALNHLAHAYNLTVEQPTWTVSELQVKSLFKEICVEYYKVMLCLADKYLGSNKDQALDCAMRAIKLAEDSDYKLGIFDCHLKCGDCYFAKDMIYEALEQYQKGLQYCRSQFCPERICWANFKIASAFQELEDYEQAVKHLNVMKRAATKYDLKELLGDAALAAARNHLRLAQTDLAQANLKEAVFVFNGIQNSDKLNEARCVMAMTRAQPLFDVYLDTIFKMDKTKLGENKYLEQLLDWKALRKPFWSVDGAGLASVSTTNTEFEVGEYEEALTSESSGSLDDIDVDSFHFPYANTSLDPIL